MATATRTRVAPPLLDWSEDHRGEFARGVVSARHQLARLPLFTDEALAAMLDRHDRDNLDVCTMGRDPAERSSWRDVPVCRHLPGHHLIEAVHQTRLWVHARHALDTDSELKPVFAAMMDQLRHLNPGWAPLRAYGGVVIASPGAQVFLHSDISETMMFQVRGSQQVFVYPPRDPWVSDRALEGVLLGEAGEDLPYDPSWDSEAARIDMERGSFAAWPLHAPHRIRFGNELSVTLVLEVVTQGSLVKNGVLHANGLMRRAGLNPRNADTRGLGAAAKLAISRAAKTASAIRKRREAQPVSDMTLAGALEQA
ncbi:hypothetical protein [Glycocaulis sp.]|uniref:hypothetical protein n=1 Tax=Glycocaulis sp. TaxID=1969725 RepID=UPI003F716EC1